MSDDDAMDAPSASTSTSALPPLVAFDLDYTLWPLWVDTHVSPPLKRKGDEMNVVHDRYGQPIRFYPDVPDILFSLSRSQTHIAACSRTHAPDVAMQALTGLHLQPPSSSSSSSSSGKEHDDAPIKALSLFDTLEIYPGSKMKHFKRLHEKTGIAYDDMLFFDDESRNAEVTSLGVHFVLVGAAGVDNRTFESALLDWRTAKARGETVGSPAWRKERGRRR